MGRFACYKATTEFNLEGRRRDATKVFIDNEEEKVEQFDISLAPRYTTYFEWDNNGDSYRDLTQLYMITKRWYGNAE